MMKKMEIEGSVFLAWKEHAVTKVLFEYLNNNKKFIEEGVLLGESLFNNRGELHLAHELGVRDGLNIILNITLEQLINPKNVDEGEVWERNEILEQLDTEY